MVAGEAEIASIIDEILAMANRIRAGEMQISEVVDGFVSSEEADDYVAEEDFDEFDEDEEEGAGTSKALTKKLEEMKHSPNPKTRQRATFALNARKWGK
jgi:hypothetical protein